MKQFSKELGKVSITPKGDWNSSIANEKLDIVYDRRNNQAYIAKQDVPIGVDIDNREYWQPLNATGYADNNFINLTAENENGTITAYESLEEAVATIFPINRRVGATLSFYNLNSDRLDRQAEFELWQFNSTDLANWENRDYWNNIYYNWNVFAGWYIDADALNNHVNLPNVGQYAYVGSNLNDAILYQCRTNGTWTNTGIKVRNYISVVVSGNITIGENGNWFSDGEDTGIPATPAVDEQLDNIITKHESLSRTVQGIAVTGGASTATNVTYNNDTSGLNAENAQDAIDEIATKNKAQDAIIETKAEKLEVATELDKKFDKENISQDFGDLKDKVVSQFALPFRKIESLEFIKAIVDAEDHFLFGIKPDGSIEWSKGIPAPIRTKLQDIINQCQKDKTDFLEAINAAKEELSASITILQEKVGTIDTNLKELVDVFSLQENPEYMAVETDEEGKVLSATNPDGSKTFYTSLIPKSSIELKDRTIYEDEVEDYKELLLDSDNKILRYTDKNDVVHENRETIFRSMKSESDSNESEISIPRTMNLPKYGYTNIVEETFYLTANAGYADKEGVLAMQVYEDTEENAKKGLTLFKYYVKSSLQNVDGVFSVKDDSIALNFYVPSSIKEVNGRSYVTSSLTKENDGSYSTNSNSIEVTKIVDKPNVQAWAVDKNSKHWCVVDIDFGSYLKGTYYVLVSFQGSSTLYGRKKNFRYAFVKDDYKTKLKLRIGELLRVDKFNLKSYSSDDTKLKEPIIFRLYLQTKELRNFKEQYPWSKSAIISTGATGIIKNFPVCTSVGGEFYGIQFFGYKKDKANYMLSKDADGMILSGGPDCTWDSFNWSTWEDEMNDEATESNRVAVEKFYNFINGADFTKENAPKHMNINDWIDYYIFIQLFRLRDNDIHNLILYSGKDKEIFSPFLYDLDLSFGMYKDNLESNKRNTVWIKLAALYWDEICKRYWQLRKIVLNEYNFNAIVSDIQTNMDYSDFEKEAKKWGVRNANNTTSSLSDTFNELLSYFDLYFKK